MIRRAYTYSYMVTHLKQTIYLRPFFDRAQCAPNVWRKQLSTVLGCLEISATGLAQSWKAASISNCKTGNRIRREILAYNPFIWTACAFCWPVFNSSSMYYYERRVCEVHLLPLAIRWRWCACLVRVDRRQAHFKSDYLTLSTRTLTCMHGQRLRQRLRAHVEGTQSSSSARKRCHSVTNINQINFPERQTLQME